MTNIELIIIVIIGNSITLLLTSWMVTKSQKEVRKETAEKITRSEEETHSVISAVVEYLNRLKDEVNRLNRFN